MKSIFFLISLFAFQIVEPAEYLPVDSGSKVHFVIKNFGINTGGDFTGLNGEIFFDPANVSKSSFNVTIKSSTIDTDNELRDKSLKKDYFESEKYPVIRMASTKIEKTNKTGEGYYYFTGNLTIKNITKSVSFPFKVEKSNNGYTFSGDFEINRLDFQVGENSVVLSNIVKVSLQVTALKK
mgnify:FL=1